MGWLNAWRIYSGGLPDGSIIPAFGDASKTWSVTANFPDGNHTVSGDGWCGPSKTLPPTSINFVGTACWCRMTSPHGGPWVFDLDYYDWDGRNAEHCAVFCAHHCGLCVLSGGHACTRWTLLN